MATVITRTGYCEECARQHRPFKGNTFLAYGTFRAAYYVRNAMHDGVRGFTPHLFILKEIVDNQCFVEKICCMYGCGVELREDNRYAARRDAWEEFSLSIPDWNELMRSNRDSQYYV